MDEPCMTNERREAILRRLIHVNEHSSGEMRSVNLDIDEKEIPTVGELRISQPVIEKRLKNFMRRSCAYNVNFPLSEIFVAILLQKGYWFQHITCNVLKSPNDFMTFWSHASDLAKSNAIHSSISSLIGGRSGTSYFALHERDINISRNVPRYIKNRENCSYLYLIEKGIITHGVDEFIRNISNERSVNHSYIHNRVKEMKDDVLHKHVLSDDLLNGRLMPEIGESCDIVHMEHSACMPHECIIQSTDNK